MKILIFLALLGIAVAIPRRAKVPKIQPFTSQVLKEFSHRILIANCAMNQ